MIRMETSTALITRQHLRNNIKIPMYKECCQTRFIMTIIFVIIIIINVNFVLMTSTYQGQNVPPPPPPPPPGYRNYSKILQDMHQLVEMFPNLARVESITSFGRRTYLGNEIFALRITKDVNQEHDRPKYYFFPSHMI